MSTIRQLEWFEDPVPCSEEEIRKIEGQLGVRFPEDYREFLATSGGGSPIETDFVINEPRGRFEASIGIFLSAGDGEYGIVPTLANVESRAIRGLIPIAESGGGDLVCLDYRTTSTPSLVYWHQGRHGLDDEVVPISDSFMAFLELLQEPNDE